MKKMTDEELSKKDLEDMKHIFSQNDNEILDVPSMINKVLPDQTDQGPKFIKEDITLEEPLTYSRKD